MFLTNLHVVSMVKSDIRDPLLHGELSPGPGPGLCPGLGQDQDPGLGQGTGLVLEVVAGWFSCFCSNQLSMLVIMSVFKGKIWACVDTKKEWLGSNFFLSGIHLFLS